MEVVRRLKRASGQKRVGHGGTLDPVATGVVPVLFGQATRVMEYLINGTKDYRTEVRLGVETDTYDSLGQVVRERDASSITEEDVVKALESFKGAILQVPPMFSALKREGKRLYDLARAGGEVEREPREVVVESIEIVAGGAPIAAVDVRCGRGFYVRSFAHDLGQALGCGAHMQSLVRIRTGPFVLDDALSLEEAEVRLEAGDARNVLSSPDIVVRKLRAAVVGSKIEAMIKNGRSVPTALGIPQAKSKEECRVYTQDGRFLALIFFNPSEAQWQPSRVFDLNAPR